MLGLQIVAPVDRETPNVLPAFFNLDGVGVRDVPEVRFGDMLERREHGVLDELVEELQIFAADDRGRSG